jgi:hypothetical protein
MSLLPKPPLNFLLLGIFKNLFFIMNCHGKNKKMFQHSSSPDWWPELIPDGHVLQLMKSMYGTRAALGSPASAHWSVRDFNADFEWEL